jgi:nitrite reductase/ring-hydroxylating ferredoxin subunit/uncharacterized membrane protein
VARFLTRLIDAQGPWARPLGNFIHGIVNWLFRHMKPIQSFLNGTWLGHPIHAVLTDVPIGAYTLVIILDVLDQRSAADVALVFGILSMVAAAAAGFADYAETDGLPRQRATVHSSLMIVALVIYLLSLYLRWLNPADRTVPIAASIVAYLVLTAGAYVGGDVVYVLGNMVDRHAFRSRTSKWTALEAPADIPEGALIKAKAAGQALVLVRHGDTINGIHDVCAHAGCSLADGKIVDSMIECPCHGSRYEIANGHVRRGPSVYDQPAYEIRRAAEGWEARRADVGQS